MPDIFDLQAQLNVQMGNTERDLKAAQTQVKALETRLAALEGGQKKASRAASDHGGILSHVLGHSLQDVTSKVQGATHEFGGLGSAISSAAGSVGSMTGPVGMALGSIAAIATTAVGAGFAIFELAEKAAKYGDSIQDAHLKTSLSVDSIQALKVAGAQAGMEIEAMSSGLVKFTNNLGAADDGNKEMVKFMKSQGVTAFEDSSKALGQFLTHFATLRSDEEKTQAVSKAFGAKFGANMIETFDIVGGNIDEFTKKLKEQGVLMSEDEVKASDAFMDKLNELEHQFSAISNTIGLEVLPTFMALFYETGKSLEENQAKWHEWGKNVNVVLQDIITVGRGVKDVIGDIGDALDWAANKWDAADKKLSAIAHYGNTHRFGQQMAPDYVPSNDPNPYLQGPNVAKPRSVTSDGSFPLIRGLINQAADNSEEGRDTTIKPPHPKGTHDRSGGGGKGGGSDPFAEQKRLAEMRLKIVLDGFKSEEDAEKRSLSERQESLEEYTDNAIDIEARRLEAVEAGLDQEAAAAVRLKKGSAAALLGIDLKRSQEISKSREVIAKLGEDLDKAEIAKAKQREDAILEIQNIADTTAKDHWQKLADDRVVTAEEAAARIGDIEMQALSRQINALYKQRDRLGPADSDERREINLQLGRLEAQQGALSIATEVKVNDAKKATLQTQWQFNLEMEKTLASIKNQDLETEKSAIQRRLAILGPGKNGRNTDAANQALDDLNIQQENARYELALREEAEKQLQAVMTTTPENMQKVWELYYQNIDSMERAHQEAISQIRDRSLIELRQKVEQTAQTLTNIIDHSLSEGFQHGVKAGLLEFAKGILEIIRDQALKNLETAIADAIMKGIAGGQGGGGGGGGGIWSMLFGIVMGGLSGGLGHGIGGGGSGPAGAKAAWLKGGGLATGGPAFAGQPVLVGDRSDRQPEIFLPSSNGHVFTQDQFREMFGAGGGGVMHNHYHSHTWHVTSPNPAAFMGRDTQAQITRQATRSMNVSTARRMVG